MKVLWIGDDVLQGIVAEVRKKTEAKGNKAIIFARCGSTSGWWARNSNLRGLIEDTSPSAVAVVLGSVDLHYKPKEIAEDIQQIVNIVGKRKIIWIGPPSVPPETSKIYSDILGKRFVDLSEVHAPGGAFGRLLSVDRYGHMAKEIIEKIEGALSKRRLFRWVAGSAAAASAGVGSLGFILGWW